MRRGLFVWLCAVLCLVGRPAPAHAWFEWLEEYSGPGPFAGFSLQWRLYCIVDHTPELTLRTKLEADRATAQAAVDRGQVTVDRDQAKVDVLTLQSELAPLLRQVRPEQELTEANQTLEKAKEELAKATEALRMAQGDLTKATQALTYQPFNDALSAIRLSEDPGDYVMRSLDSFKGFWHGVNWIAGTGCPVKQTELNPLGSLNFRVAALWSVRNHLQYADPQFQNGGPLVTLLQPELSFTVFVDSRKSVEVGNALGISRTFVRKDGVNPFNRFYWRPIILNISPVSLLRVANPPAILRAIIFSSSIVIMPQELKDTDFGAVPGTFTQSREILGQFEFALDLSRFNNPSSPKK